MRRAIIEAIAIYCGLTNDEPYVPSTSPRAQRIINAIQAQHDIGMQHPLKGRVVKVMFDPQLEYCQSNHQSNLPNPTIRWKAWRKKVITALVTFTLDIWNDRNAVYHGSFLDSSKQELIAHVHHSVRREYALHASDTETFMEVHLSKPLEETLQRSLTAMRN